MKKILIIDENEEFRNYLEKKFTEQNFTVSIGLNGLDGSLKMRKDFPDLIIMDYLLSRKSSIEILTEKKENPNLSATPVILFSNKIDKRAIVELPKYGVKKIFSKPVKIDSLFKGISELFNIVFTVDETPCIIEANFNDEIIFIEIARGLNIEKIEILQLRLNELIGLYHITQPKILVMMSGIDINEKNIFKLRKFLEIVVSASKNTPEMITILTGAKEIKNFIQTVSKFNNIKVRSNLNDALDELIGIKGDTFAHDKVFENSILNTKSSESLKGGKIEMRFENEEITRKLETAGTDIKIAIVDDDIVIRQLLKATFKSLPWKLDMYENGKKFVDALSGEDKEYNLIFLDLMMPELDGFGVLEYLKKNKITVPVIVFSALSQKETVVKTLKYGVKTYMTKPLKTDVIKRKTVEILIPEF